MNQRELRRMKKTKIKLRIWIKGHHRIIGNSVRRVKGHWRNIFVLVFISKSYKKGRKWESN